MRILLLPAGEEANSSLGDPMECATQLATRPLASGIRLGYPHYDRSPGWYADRDQQEGSPERAVLSAALEWTAVDDAPLYLMGFSKSGYAALSILARHWRLGLFSGAAAWDAPLMLTGLTRSSMVRSYGTEEAFSKHCLVNRIPDLAEAVSTAGLKLVMDGFVVWGVQMRNFHELLRGCGVDHVYSETRRAAHCWDPAWMETCVHGLGRVAERGNISAS